MNLNKYLYIQRSDSEKWNSELKDANHEEEVLKELEKYGKMDEYERRKNK